MAELKAKSFEDLIKRFNPFGIKDEVGNSMVFEDYGEVYKYTISYLREHFPKGFIDVPLMLHQLTKVPLTDAQRFARNFKYISLNLDTWLIEWDCEELNPKYKCELLMRALHTLSETKFSPDYFNWAWEQAKK